MGKKLLWLDDYRNPYESDWLIFSPIGRDVDVIWLKSYNEFIEYIEQNGGKVVKAISNKVNYLINNDINSTSTKNAKAKELDIKIISEDDLLKMVNS